MTPSSVRRILFHLPPSARAHGGRALARRPRTLGVQNARQLPKDPGAPPPWFRPGRPELMPSTSRSKTEILTHALGP
eukprot:2260718-Pyramimonas_sp.AAC.1